MEKYLNKLRTFNRYANRLYSSLDEVTKFLVWCVLLGFVLMSNTLMEFVFIAIVLGGRGYYLSGGIDNEQ